MSYTIKYSLIKERLFENNIPYVEDIKLNTITYFKSGGKVKIFVIPITIEQMFKCISILNSLNFEYKIIGQTTNVVFFNEITYSILISTSNLQNLTHKTNYIEVQAGYRLEDLVRYMIINRIGGYEGLEGIPGTVGGAILMNAGAYGDTISDNIISVKCVDNKNNITELSKEQCNFNRRDSIFRNSEYTILSAKFSCLLSNDKNKIERNIEKYHIARHSYQEYVYPNLGSMITIDKNIYGEIFKKNRIFFIIYYLFRLLLKNPVSRFIARKRPNNSVFNWLLKIYIKKYYNMDMSEYISKKGLNILLNDYKRSSNNLVRYMKLISDLLDNKYRIENEFVTDSVAKVDENFLDTFYTAQNLMKNY